MKLNWWEKDPHAISGTPFDSLTEPQVRRIVEMVAETENMTFEGAQELLVERWEADALRAEAQGLSTWKLWARLGRIAAGLVMVLALATPAHAVDVTQFAWDRTGAEHLPCSGSVDWLLSPGDGIDNATVGINDNDGIPDGHAWTMLKNWDTGEWYIQTTEPVAVDDEVLVAYVGTVSPPELTLTGCAPATVQPPVVPPVVDAPPAPPSVPVPSTPTNTTWDIGFTVTTHRATNVLVKWRVECSTATASAGARGRFVGNTPLERHIPQTLPDATHCEIHVAAWDRRPWVAPHHGQRPVVTTWVAGSGKDGR